MFPFFFYDFTMIILLPAIILTMYAQYKVNSTFNKFSRVPTKAGWTGELVAKALLERNGITDVSVKMVQGHLSDHYDPRNKTINLSKSVHSGSSIASLGVAAHETGHAMQHADGYLPLRLRTAFVPLASLGSSLAIPLIIIGLFITTNTGTAMINIGILMFTLAVLFQVITLPVEFNASRRATNMLYDERMVDEREADGVAEVLRAAALTYVASAATALSQLARLLFITSGRRNNNQ